MLGGWLSKLWSLFGYPKYWVPYYNKDPKRDHNFDNHPGCGRVKGMGARIRVSRDASPVIHHAGFKTRVQLYTLELRVQSTRYKD